MGLQLIPARRDRGGGTGIGHLKKREKNMMRGATCGGCVLVVVLSGSSFDASSAADRDPHAPELRDAGTKRSNFPALTTSGRAHKRGDRS